MDEQEQRDLQDMHFKSNEIRMNAFNIMRMCLQMKPDEVSNSGYSTMEAAVVGTFKFAQAKLDKLLKEHLKKYPD